MRGRKPKLPSLKLLEGMTSHTPTHTIVEPQAGIPRAPSHLTGAAREGWDWIVSELAKLGRMSLAYEKTCEAFASAYGTLIAARKEIAKRGSFYKSGDLIKANPAIKVQSDSLATMRQYLVECGLTPVSNQRVDGTAPTRVGGDGLRDFLGLPAGRGNVG